MKQVIPSFASKQELFSYLRKNADKLIAQKKALPIYTDNLEFGYSIKDNFKPNAANKAAGDNANNTEMVEGELPVDVIGNVSGWCDSQMDVMIKDNWNKSINDLGASGEKIMYHLKNHDYKTDAIIAKDASLYTKDVDLSMFNIKTDIKKAQALLMSSTVCEKYDAKTYMLYKDKQIKQHSIGLQYVKIYMCIDSDEPEDTQYKDNWNKYYPGVINKEKVDSRGYFWAVTEAKILEVSAVLFGSNELTPTLEGNKNDTHIEPSKDTQDKPSSEKQSVRICGNCTYMFSAEGSTAKCPSCGQFSNQTTVATTFDVGAAIQETTFLN